jgi:hypothetical protein
MNENGIVSELPISKQTNLHELARFNIKFVDPSSASHLIQSLRERFTALIVCNFAPDEIVSYVPQAISSLNITVERGRQ